MAEKLSNANQIELSFKSACDYLLTVFIPNETPSSVVYKNEKNYEVAILSPDDATYHLNYNSGIYRILLWTDLFPEKKTRGSVRIPSRFHVFVLIQDDYRANAITSKSMGTNDFQQQNFLFKWLKSLENEFNVVKSDYFNNLYLKAFGRTPIKIFGIPGVTMPTVNLFMIILNGVCSVAEEVEIIQFDIGQNTQGFAIRITLHSLISDASTWAVFPDFCSKFSGTASMGLRLALEEIDKLEVKYGKGVSIRNLKLTPEEGEFFWKNISLYLDKPNEGLTIDQIAAQDLDYASQDLFRRIFEILTEDKSLNSKRLRKKLELLIIDQHSFFSFPYSLGSEQIPKVSNNLGQQIREIVQYELPSLLDPDGMSSKYKERFHTFLNKTKTYLESKNDKKTISKHFNALYPYLESNLNLLVSLEIVADILVHKKDVSINWIKHVLMLFWITLRYLLEFLESNIEKLRIEQVLFSEKEYFRFSR